MNLTCKAFHFKNDTVTLLLNHESFFFSQVKFKWVYIPLTRLNREESERERKREISREKEQWIGFLEKPALHKLNGKLLGKSFKIFRRETVIAFHGARFFDN